MKTQRLPSPSGTALRVLELASKPDASIPQVADAIATDPAISARLLKYANSPIVASRQSITTIRQAVMVLGLRAVKVTALSFSLVRKQDFSACPHFNFDLYWAHATATATAARGIIAVTAPSMCEEGFVAGLLARIGKLAFATTIPEEYEQVLIKTGNVMHGGTTEERAAFDMDNIELGAELLARWNLPSLLVEAVRFQACPEEAADAQVRQLASAVQHGRQIADMLCGVVSRAQESTIDQLANANLAQIEHQFHEVANVLNISLKELPEPDEIEDRARNLMEEISVAAETENKAIVERNKELETQALVDPLTNVGNRKAFDQHLAAELERSRRYARPMSLLVMDLDDFKKINDTHGHLVGDAVLKAVGAAITGALRRCDFAARYGGEEFAVIAGETDAAAARHLAERLRSRIEALTCKTQQGAVKVTVSIGSASCGDGHDLPDAAEIIAAADKKLYEAKRSGKNCCRDALSCAGLKKPAFAAPRA